MPLLYVNFMARAGTWSVHCLSPDARTGVSPHLTVASDALLLRLFRAVGATEQQVKQVATNARRWGRGTVLVDVNEAGLRLLRVNTSLP